MDALLVFFTAKTILFSVSVMPCPLINCWLWPMGSLDRSSEGGREVGHGIYFLGFPREYLDHTVIENLNNVNLV